MESSHLFCMMWIACYLWSQCKGNWPHLNLIWGTLTYFALLRQHLCSSSLVSVLFWTLWSSVKQIEAPYVFDWENRIALHAMQGNRASSRGEGEVSWVFMSYGRNLCIFSSYSGDIHSKLEFVHRSQDTCLGMRNISGI